MNIFAKNHISFSLKLIRSEEFCTLQIRVENLIFNGFILWI